MEYDNDCFEFEDCYIEYILTETWQLKRFTKENVNANTAKVSFSFNWKQEFSEIKKEVYKLTKAARILVEKYFKI